MLGEADLRALDDLYARVVWIPGGALDRLDDAAREYRRIVGEPDDPPNASGGQRGDSGEGGGEAGSGSRHRGGSEGQAGPGSLADALGQAIASARADQLEQLDQDVDPKQVLADAAPGGKAGRQLGKGRGTGLPSGRMPDRGVDRPPTPSPTRRQPL